MLKTRISADVKYEYYKAARRKAYMLQTIIGMCFANIVALFWPNEVISVFAPNQVVIGLFYLICLVMFKLVGR